MKALGEQSLRAFAISERSFMAKRITAMLLVILLIAGIMPAAYAAEGETDGEVKTVGDIFGNEKLQANDEWIAKSFEKYQDAYNKTAVSAELIQELVSLSKENMWFSYLLKSFDSDLGWIDFEKEIAVVIHSFQELLRVRGTSFVINKDVSTPEGQYVVRKFDFYLQKEDNINGLPTGITRVKQEYVLEYPKGSKNKIINKEKIAGTLSAAADRLKQGLKLYLKCFVDNVVETLRKSGELKPNVLFSYTDYVFTFNYTSTYEKLYPYTEVFHIHGNLNKNIVLGINPDSFDEVGGNDTSFISFKKYFQRTMFETDVGYIKWVRENKNESNVHLLVMGHSLDITDEDIISELFELSSRITIAYHSKSSESSFIANLIKIFGKEKFSEMRKSKELTFIPLDGIHDDFIRQRECGRQANDYAM